jgi:ATP-binding cassette subfamily C (CFTR/MRP) protein 1
MIYSNTLTLGMGAFESSKALTLMSTDVEAICDASQQLFEFPASIVECALAFWLIYNQAGVGFISPAIVAALSVGIMSFVAKYMGRAQAVWIKAIETRVTSTAAWVTNAKVVKMLGFSDILENSLQKLRQDEVNLSRKFRKIFTVRVMLSMYISVLLTASANELSAFLQAMLAPILTFGILIATGHSVNSSNIFSIISILTLLAGKTNESINLRRRT